MIISLIRHYLFLEFGQKGMFAENFREQKLRHHKLPQLFLKLSETELNA